MWKIPSRPTSSRMPISPLRLERQFVNVANPTNPTNPPTHQPTNQCCPVFAMDPLDSPLDRLDILALLQPHGQFALTPRSAKILSLFFSRERLKYVNPPSQAELPAFGLSWSPPCALCTVEEGYFGNKNINDVNSFADFWSWARRPYVSCIKVIGGPRFSRAPGTGDHVVNPFPFLEPPKVAVSREYTRNLQAGGQGQLVESLGEKDSRRFLLFFLSKGKLLSKGFKQFKMGCGKKLPELGMARRIPFF